MTIGRFGPSGLRRPNGKALTSESVQVFLAGTSTSAELFTGLAGTTPLANPVTTDAFGNLTFCAEEGSYDLLVNGARVTVPVDGAPVGGGGGGGSSSLTFIKGREDYSRNRFGITYIVDDFFGDPQTYRTVGPDTPLVPGGPSLGVEQYGDVFDLYVTPGHVRPTIPGIYDVRFNIVISGASTDGIGARPVFVATVPISGYGDDTFNPAIQSLNDPERFTVPVEMRPDAKDGAAPPQTSGSYVWHHGVPFSGGDEEFEWTEVTYQYTQWPESSPPEGNDAASWGGQTKLEITFYPILVDLS